MGKDKDINIKDYLMQKVWNQQHIHLNRDQYLAEFGYEMLDIMEHFETMWNFCVDKKKLSNNPLCLCYLLGMMHQVYENNKISHNFFDDYFMKEEAFDNIVLKELVENNKLFSANKAFAMEAPGVLGKVDEEKGVTPMFIALWPIYNIIYETGKDYIKNFREENYPDADLRYWNP